jgi:outer membrane receptor protein involved in Fe transport
MFGLLLIPLLFTATPAAPDSSVLRPTAAIAADSIATPPDSSAAKRRVVRQFPTVEVSALLHDLRSSETVRLVPGSVLRNVPIDGLADVLALQPGVVAQGEELHVRGGRSGELQVNLDGMSLKEPLRLRAMDVPITMLRSAELVSGAPDAQYGGGLAGVLDLRTVEPTERFSSDWRWQTDGGTQTRYDRVAGRASVPLSLFGLGVVTAGDVTLDDTWMPSPRVNGRHEIAGLSWGWRAENRMLGYAKLAPVGSPERFSAQVLVSREIHEPFNPNFTIDGWIYAPPNLKETPVYSPTPQDTFQRYRAADHTAITDDRQIATLLKLSSLGATQRLSLRLGWLRTRTVLSIDGHREPVGATHRPRYGSPTNNDRFVVLWGDYPLYRESSSDVVTLRGDAALTKRTGSIGAGAGLTYEAVSMREMDWMPFAIRSGDPLPLPYDSTRSYQAYAPGEFAYVQGRWLTGGMILNTGVRAEYWTAGPQANGQTLPWSGKGVWSFAPRLGIAYPISVSDVFSLAYVRIHQAPGRDFLYDQRVAISDRQPLGNPDLVPSTLISYEAAVKHLFGPTWALQTSVFYRDVFGQIGALDFEEPNGLINLRYENSDESHAVGFEVSVIHASGERSRIEASYVYMNAWGNESRPEGDPYGPIRGARTPSVSDQPLSWDRRHSIRVNGFWHPDSRWTISWSTAVGSPLPWTPKPFRAPQTDLNLINSRRLTWVENTNLALAWSPPHARGVTVGFEARNLFNERNEHAATLDGYPNPEINTRFDDYGAYRTATGLPGGAYWSRNNQDWIPVRDPRLYDPTRAVRASIGKSW